MSTATTTATTTAPPATPGEQMSQRERLRLILVLGSLIAIGPLTIDMYLPALPAITDDLLTTSAAVQLTLTGTLIGMGVGQLLIGPLSDAFGRRAPLLAGLALHVLASVLCVVAPTIAVLGALRVVQGVGVAATAVVAMAIVRDLFSGVAFAALFSRLMLVMGIAPILAPTLGGALLTWTDWRGVFAALAVIGVLLMVLAAVALTETLPPRNRLPARLAPTIRTYGALLRDRTFVGLIVVAGLAMGAVFAYVAGSSFAFQEQYGLSEQQFAVVFSAGAVGLIGATQLNVRLLRRYSPQQVVVTALLGGTAAGLVLVGFAATGLGGLLGILVPLWLVMGAAGFTLPNAPALAMSRHGEAAGTAAALLGSVQFTVGGLAAPAVGLLGDESLAMGTVMAGTMLAASAVMLVVGRGGRLAIPVGGTATAPIAEPAGG